MPAAGGALLDPAVARKVMAEFGRLSPPASAAGLVEALSARELAVLRLLAEGTVLQMIVARDRTQAALCGRELGLI
jgi:DNA-binding NarL/FixJ family response regulator